MESLATIAQFCIAARNRRYFVQIRGLYEIGQRFYGVIALNSSPYYPRYNVAIEYVQHELKAKIDRLTSQGMNLDETLSNRRRC